MGASSFDLYKQYRTGNPYGDITPKHNTFLNWIEDQVTFYDNPDTSGYDEAEEGLPSGEGLSDLPLSNYFPEHDPTGMEISEEQFKTTVGVAYNAEATQGSEGGTATEPGEGAALDWELVSIMEAGQAPTAGTGYWDEFTGQEGSLLFQHGLDMETAWNDYKNSARDEREALLTGTSTAMNEMGLLSGTSGQVLKSGEAMKNISSDIEDAGDIAKNLSETYELGMDTAEMTFNSGMETSFNNYMQQVDSERVNWSNQIVQGMLHLSSQEIIESAPLFDIDNPPGEECPEGFDPQTGECVGETVGGDIGGGGNEGACGPDEQYINGECVSQCEMAGGWGVCSEDSPNYPGQCVASADMCGTIPGIGGSGGFSFEEQFDPEKQGDCEVGEVWDIEAGACVPVLGQ